MEGNRLLLLSIPTFLDSRPGLPRLDLFLVPLRHPLHASET